MRKKNDGGYILIVVLLVFAVLSIVGMTVAGVAMSGTKQTSQNIGYLQARKAAEMGLKDYQKLIRDKAQWIRDQEISPTETNPDVAEQLKSMLDEIPETYDSDGKFQGLSGDPKYTVEQTDTEYNPDDKTVRWELKSTGTVNGNSRSITENVVISLVNTEYQENSEEITPEYMGITLPYHDGSLLAGKNIKIYRSHATGNDKDKYKEYNSSDIQNAITETDGVKIYTDNDDLLSGETNGQIIFRGDVSHTGGGQIKGEMEDAEEQFENMLPDYEYLFFDGISEDINKNVILVGPNGTTREHITLNGNVLHLFQEISPFIVKNSYTVNGYYYVNPIWFFDFDIAPRPGKHFVYNRTVYVDGNLEIDVEHGSTVEFREGIVCSGTVWIKVGNNSKIIFGREKKASEEKASVSLKFETPEYR